MSEEIVLEEIDECDVDTKDNTMPRIATYFHKFKNLLEQQKRAAIFTHAYPDPDAIGSIMAMSWLLDRAFNIPSDAFYVGPVSHPQNVAMVNLLDPDLKSVDEYVADSYSIKILVDTVPSNAGVAKNRDKPIFDLVIDHHKETCGEGFEGLFINLKAGSCCATVYDLIDKAGLVFEENNDADTRVATAILVGVATDTENLMSDDATQYEFKAWSNSFEFKNSNLLKQIVNFERPKFWIDHKAEAIMHATSVDGVSVVGMGVIPAKHRDMIADMADEMARWEGIHTGIAFAIVDNTRIEGSVRSSNASLSVPKLCKELGGAFGGGGGKLGKGAYKYDLGGGSIYDDDDDETKDKTWLLYNEKETKRVQRIMKK